MPKLIKLKKNLTFSSQIDETFIAELSILNYKKIICNRPDGESPDQPKFKDLKRIADGYDIEMVYMPVQNSHFAPNIVYGLMKELEETDGKVLMYCLSGVRSVILWAIATIQSGTLEEEVFYELSRIGLNSPAVKKLIQDAIAGADDFTLE